MVRTATPLRILIVAHLVWTFLLTPAAFETRPFSTINPVGWFSLVLIFTTVGFDIAAFILATRSPRTAGLLAAVGPLLFVGPFIGDLAGFFSTLPAPTSITVLETIAFVTQLAIGYVGLHLRSETAPA